MDDANAGPAVDGDADHAGDVVQMAFSEAFRAIERVNPNHHVFLEELVGKFIVVVICLGRRHPIYLLHLLQVAAIAVLLHVVVLDKHLLADVVLVELVWHDVRRLCHDQIFHLVFFADNGGAWVQLAQIVHDCVLDVNVHLCENVLGTATLLHRNVGETGDFAHAVNQLVRALEQLDAGGHKLIELNYSFHL